MKIWKEKRITFGGAVLQSCALFWCSAVLALLTFPQKVAAFKLSLRTYPSLRMRGLSSFLLRADRPLLKKVKRTSSDVPPFYTLVEQRCNAELSVLVPWKPISSLRLLSLTLCPTVNFRNSRCSGVWMRSSWVFMKSSRVMDEIYKRAWMRSSQILVHTPYARVDYLSSS
jgi:hypothetical protein